MTAADKLRELLASRPAMPNTEELVRWWRSSAALLPAVLHENAALKVEADKRLGAWQASVELGNVMLERDRLLVSLRAEQDARAALRVELNEARAERDAARADFACATIAMEALAPRITDVVAERDVLKQEVRELEHQRDAARAAARTYAARVEELGLAADDNDPKVMATAEPIGAAQADLWHALGMIAIENGRLGKCPAGFFCMHEVKCHG